MRDSWDGRIHRAETLSSSGGAADAMLAFYVYLLRIQKDIYESFRNRSLTGELASDATPEMQLAPKVLTATVSKGPVALRERAEQHRLSVLPFLHSHTELKLQVTGF